jgi:hypothetical protein
LRTRSMITTVSHKYLRSMHYSNGGMGSTWSRGSFMTAFMLSREAHPSGQFKRPFLTYFSACRLHIRNK